VAAHQHLRPLFEEARRRFNVRGPSKGSVKRRLTAGL
jgi:hypothetical protein